MIVNERSRRVALIGALILSGVATMAQQPAVPSVTRTILNQQDLAIPGYAAAVIRVELAPGAREGRHHHPGTLIGHVLEGVITLEHAGRPTTEYKTGETFHVDPGKVHEGTNHGRVPVKILATVVFPKAQPMTVPAE